MSQRVIQDFDVLQVKKDGNKWSVGLANVNMQESPMGFGDTIAEALRELARDIEAPQPVPDITPKGIVRTEPKDKSSNVVSYGYSERFQVLEIEFRNGAVYQYFDVPVHVFHEMEQADRAGAYLAAKIKGRYRYARVDR